MARFSGRVVVTHWLPRTPVQNLFFCLVLMHKKVSCYLFSLSIQTRVLAVTFCITLIHQKKLNYKLLFEFFLMIG